VAQDVEHRPDGEDRDAGRDDADSAGREAIAPEGARISDAVGEQQQECDECERCTDADAKLPVVERTDRGLDRGQLPALAADQGGLQHEARKAERPARDQKDAAAFPSELGQDSGQRDQQRHDH
jgi:hypothetical protein